MSGTRREGLAAGAMMTLSHASLASVDTPLRQNSTLFKSALLAAVGCSVGLSLSLIPS